MTPLGPSQRSGQPRGVVLSTCLALVTCLGALACGAEARGCPAGADAGCREAPCGDTGGEVRTPLGVARGKEDANTCAFLGLPFAARGLARWSQVTPTPSWKGLFDATRFGPACAQLADGELVGSEDCLTLNVWSPGGSGLPVLVFFHGGGNVSGSSRQAVYRGAHLASTANVVVVTANYRLGPFGYFEYPDASAPLSPEADNFALGDQVEALHWVQRNVSAFGGDPERVTVVGQSAGGRAVCALLALDEPLFQRAAIHSAACEFEPLERARAFAREIADATACSNLACLRDVPVETLLHARPSLPSMTRSSRHNLAARTPLVSLARRVPLLVGSNADELLPTAPNLPTREAFLSLLATELGSELAAAVGERYFDRDTPPRDAYVRALTEARYHCHAERTATLPTTTASGVGVEPGTLPLGPGAPRYRFLLDRPLDGPAQRALGSYHGLELVYLFGTFQEVDYSPSAGDRAFSERLMRVYATFAWTGELTETEGWPDHRLLGDTLVLSDSDALERRPRTEHCEFWAANAP